MPCKALSHSFLRKESCHSIFIEDLTLILGVLSRQKRFRKCRIPLLCYAIGFIAKKVKLAIINTQEHKYAAETNT
jgi:hypothetical protein